MGIAAGREQRPQALERYRGQTTGRRHHGVYHYQRQTGRHPHPHRYAARKRVAEHPQPPGGNGHSQAPLHHHQHVTSQRHHSATRHAASTLEVGQIVAYDAASRAAMVQVLGSPVQVIGAIAVTACAPRDLALVGAACLVALLDAHNPRDGVVIAVWPAAGSGAGTKLTQVGVATIALAEASTGNVGLLFPSACAAAPAVVAPATDPAWTAAVAAITAAGCTLTVRAAAPATTTVTPNWIACGV